MVLRLLSEHCSGFTPSPARDSGHQHVIVEGDWGNIDAAHCVFIRTTDEYLEMSDENKEEQRLDTADVYSLNLCFFSPFEHRVIFIPDPQ